MVQLFSLFYGHSHARWMEPVFTSFTLDHEVIWIVWHLTLAIHSNTVRGESSGGSLVFKAAEEVISTNIFKLCIVLEGVDGALAFNGVGTLDVIVVRKEEFLGPMKLPPTTLGLLRAVIPANMYLHVVSVISLYLLHTGNIRGLFGVGWAQQNTISSFHDFVGALDAVRIEVPFPRLRLGHAKMVSAAMASVRCHTGFSR